MEKKSILLAVLLIIANFSFSFNWSPMASHPGGGSYEPSCFVINDIIYVATGTTGVSLTNTNAVWAYDPTTNSWTQKAAYAGGAVTVARSFVLNGLGYVMTGQLNGGSYTSSMYAYNPGTNSWSPKASFAGFARYTGVAMALNGKGYFGTGYQPLTNDWWEYNPSVNSWTQKASLPGLPRQSAVAFEINNIGYVGLGSYTNHPSYTPLNDLWAYDPNSNSWTSKSAFPQSGRWSAMTFVLNDEAYVGGGISYSLATGPNTVYSDYYKYNAFNDSWSFVGTFPTNRYGAVAGVTSIGVYGGLGYSGSSVQSSWYKLTGITGTDEVLSSSITMAYNPSTKQLSFDLPDEISNITDIHLSIYSIDGKLVLEESGFNSANSLITYSVENLGASSYICTLKNKDNGSSLFSGKFVVAN